MFSRTVDACERFLVKDTSQTVFVGDLLEHGHRELLMIGGDVGRFKQGRDFELAGSHFVVAGLGRDAQTVQFAVHFVHERQNALWNGSEVVIFELLSLGGLGSEQGTSGGEQIRAAIEESLIDQEIFLFRTGCGRNVSDFFVAEEAQNALGLFVQGLHGLEQRGLGVQSFAGPGYEGSGDTKSGAIAAFQDVSRAGDVPRGVSARSVRGTNAAVREGRGIRFSLDEGFALELGDCFTTAFAAFVERVVFFSRGAGERIKYVGVVGGPFADGPEAHGVGYFIRHGFG